LKTTLELVADFRQHDSETPIILMGYYNPIYIFGVDAFLSEAKAAAVDGLIIVDLPPEEENEICLPSRMAGIDFIYLTAPTTDEIRLPRVVKNASGFVYYVSITGITGTASARIEDVRKAVERLRRHTDLPIAVGFGIKTPDQARGVASVADAAVVGSALVQRVSDNLDGHGGAGPGVVPAVVDFVRGLAHAVAGGNGR
jgi:tryptophan synthase alpha chain